VLDVQRQFQRRHRSLELGTDNSNPRARSAILLLREIDPGTGQFRLDLGLFICRVSKSLGGPVRKRRGFRNPAFLSAPPGFKPLDISRAARWFAQAKCISGYPAARVLRRRGGFVRKYIPSLKKGRVGTASRKAMSRSGSVHVFAVTVRTLENPYRRAVGKLFLPAMHHRYEWFAALSCAHFSPLSAMNLP
jgi:hypothetical protein